MAFSTFYGAKKVSNNKIFFYSKRWALGSLTDRQNYYSASFLQFNSLHVIILFKYFIVKIFLILEVSQVTCD